MNRLAKLMFLVALILPGLATLSVSAAPKTIDWDTLIPTTAMGGEINLPQTDNPIGMPDLSDFDGTQEEFDMFRQDIMFMRELQPQGSRINVQLDKSQIRIAGYVTPVGFDGEDVTEFLFVPYLGACIHVPPPPANQIVYVKGAKGLTADLIFEPIWLTGTLQAKPVSTVLADVGYRIDGGKVERYTGDVEELEPLREHDTSIFGSVEN